ncbi:MAG: hypothetical protein DMG28_10375 [Acidobacteria bacterium]|nr:MAG: hypothetical protein DMG28_10375 [Acidobacteriota bacterium]
MPCAHRHTRSTPRTYPGHCRPRNPRAQAWREPELGCDAVRKNRGTPVGRDKVGPRRERLFVYGTLRRGFALHPLLRKLAERYVGRGKIQGHLYDLGRFPGAVPSSSPQNKITGEVYELSNPDKQLEELDRAEEYHREQPRNSLFVRRLSLVRLENGRRFKAWVYFLPRRPSKARPIHEGDYAETHPRRS